uniref:Uncharacterized protein n=1 Tax=virus sp. ctqq75 TaxID=2827999 RepID=A0A8S5REY5_9VIRU|nr:MAG TPA: hypothetical protein [virus sp. ctqq75]
MWCAGVCQCTHGGSSGASTIYNTLSHFLVNFTFQRRHWL